MTGWVKLVWLFQVAHQHGVTIPMIADKLGLKERTLSWRMAQDMRLSFLYDIAQAIGCDVTDLFVDV